MKKTNVAISIILAIGFTIGLGLLGSGIKQMHQTRKKITVTGVAQVNFKSDLAVWSADFYTQSKDMKKAFSSLKEMKDKILKYLSAHDIPQNKIIFSSINTRERYEHKYINGSDISTFLGYKLEQTISITSSDIEKISSLSRQITELINDGVNIESHAPHYYYKNLNKLKISMIQEASKNALKRASEIARGSNASVGELLSSQMGVFQIVGENSNEDYSWGGSFNTTSIYKTASVTVRAVYGIK